MTGEDRSGPSEPEEFGDFDSEAFDRAFEQTFGPTAAVAASPRLIAVVLTPVRSAPALAALCRLHSIEATVLPSTNGALAARTITEPVDDAEMLLHGAPAQATELAAGLSRAIGTDVLLLTAHLGSGAEGVTGSISGREYSAGEPGREVPAGLVLAGADDVLESLLLGTLDPQDASGAIDPSSLPTTKLGGLFGRRRKKT